MNSIEYILTPLARKDERGDLPRIDILRCVFAARGFVPQR
jgi:hypothetical protein